MQRGMEEFIRDFEREFEGLDHYVDLLTIEDLDRYVNELLEDSEGEDEEGKLVDTM